MTDRLPVLHVVRRWGEPSETFLADLVGSLRRSSARVVAIESGSRRPPRGDPPFLDASRIPARLPRAVAARATSLGVLGASIISRACLVHAHFAHSAPVSLRTARLRGLPAVVSVHGHDVLVEAEPAGWWPTIRIADSVIVPSRYLAEVVVDHGVDPGRVAVMPSGVDIERHHPRVGERVPGPVRVLFLGRFVEKKGPLDAATAIVRAAATGTAVEGRFVGYGPLGGAVAEALGSSGVVLDGRDPATVAREFERADLVITPSRVAASGDAETLCVVNLEAQARALPVVTTDSGGIADHIGPGAGMVVAEGDLAALIEAVVALARDEAMRAAMGARGRDWILGRFDLATTTAAVEDLYVQLAARAGRR